MDPGQILWKATYPPYLQKFFFFRNFHFSNFYKIFCFQFFKFLRNFCFGNMGPYGSIYFKMLLLLIFIRFEPTKFYGTLKVLLTQSHMGLEI